MEHLCVRSIERKISLKSKIYFQIKVSLTRIAKLPDELVDLYNFNSWIIAKEEEHKINVFYNDEHKEVLEWQLVRYNKNFGLVIGEINPRFEQDGVITHDRIENLFDKCVKGTVDIGCLLYGTIVKRNVLPYEFDGKMVLSHTRPVLWPKELSDEEKKQYIKKVFAKSGRVIIDDESCLADKVLYMSASVRRNKYSESSNYDEYGGPSDGYGGYLDDDFINDAFGGDEEAYWNID